MQSIYYDSQRACRDIDFAKAFSIDEAFVTYTDEFQSLLGPSPTLRLLEKRSYKFAHEAGVYIKSTDSVYFTGNFADQDPIALYRIACSSFDIEQLHYDYAATTNANGACNYQDKLLYCCQGNRVQPSALVLADPVTTKLTVLLNNFHGIEFNSLNDVVVHHPSGDIWFTDPTYGYEQNFRPSPSLPAQVYRFRPSTGQVWCLAGGFGQCNGLCFSPNFDTLYVTDTAAVQAHGTPGNGRNFSFNPRLPSCIYAFDVVERNGSPALLNRRMFAHCTNGVPDGIKCDTQGNVYSGCGDGVHVWNNAGTLIGKIAIADGVANFNFSSHGMWILAEDRLYLCELQAKGALVEIECT